MDPAGDQSKCPDPMFLAIDSPRPPEIGLCRVPIIDDRSDQPFSGKLRGVQRYRDVLQVEGAAKFFFAAGVGRLGISMTGLGILWLVQHYTGSFASAGVVTGAFAISEALMGPQVARHIDHRGQTRMLPLLLFVHGLAAAALVASAVLDVSFVCTCLAGVAAGASVPQLGALSAARWSHLLDRSRWRRPSPWRR
jgi:hypothetical protein